MISCYFYALVFSACIMVFASYCPRNHGHPYHGFIRHMVVLDPYFHVLDTLSSWFLIPWCIVLNTISNLGCSHHCSITLSTPLHTPVHFQENICVLLTHMSSQGGIPFHPRHPSSSFHDWDIMLLVLSSEPLYFILL